jgi:hypothetical protein
MTKLKVQVHIKSTWGRRIVKGATPRMDAQMTRLPADAVADGTAQERAERHRE